MPRCRSGRSLYYYQTVVGENMPVVPPPSRRLKQEINKRGPKVNDGPIAKRYEHQMISRTGKGESVCNLVFLTERVDGLLFAIRVALPFVLDQRTEYQTSKARHKQHAKLGPTMLLVI